MSANIHSYSSLEELSTAITGDIVSTLSIAIEKTGVASIVLSGGSTPQTVYQALSTIKIIEWSKIHLFWGDERTVPPDDTQSNFRMVKESLLDHISIPEENVHRIKGEIDPAAAAQQYDKEIAAWLEDHHNFTVTLLGIGEDGHTASLFPNTDALKERQRLAVSNNVPQLKTTRITLTYPALHQSENIFFLVAGSAKAKIVHELLELGASYPASAVSPVTGDPLWFIDQNAASLLTH